MIEGSCHCGAVRVEIDVEHGPAELTSCNCSICRRLSPLWAYYSPRQVRVTGPTATYCWGDKTICFHRCVTCGCTINWSPLDGEDRMGINARLLDPVLVDAARIRRLDGADTWKVLDVPPRAW